VCRWIERLRANGCLQLQRDSHRQVAVHGEESSRPFTGGRQEASHGEGFAVTKLHSSELKIAKSLAEADGFVREL